jgi:hypothetical protein
VTRYIALVLLLACLLPRAFAQDKAAPELRRLARAAGIIFSGAVVKIEPVAGAAPGDIGLVRITFRVSHALRGATSGQSLTINEWDGLWTAGDRYRVGENLLLFLYPPSGELGLTTTVGGAHGRISLAESVLSIAEVERQIGEDESSPPVLDLPKSRRPQRLPLRIRIAQ